MKKFVKNNTPLIALVALMFILSMLEETFFTSRNLSNVTLQVAFIGIIAVGMTMVILVAGIDLSVGSIAGLAAIMVTYLMQKGFVVWAAVPITILVAGSLLGLWNGFFVAYFKIPAFIITLGMMTIARGFALILSDGSSIPVTDPIFPRLGGDYIPRGISGVLIVIVLILFLFSLYMGYKQKKKYHIRFHPVEEITKTILLILTFVISFFIFTGYRGIPIPALVFAVIVIVGSFILTNMRFGRRIYAIGGNEEAARLSGINVFQTITVVYTISSSLAAVSGIILASRLDGASPNLGSMYELDAIASVVIGGTSLSGGSGKIIGTVIGAFIIGVLNNGMSLLGVNMFYQNVIKGLIIIFAVLFDVVNKKRKT